MRETEGIALKWIEIHLARLKSGVLKNAVLSGSMVIRLNMKDQGETNIAGVLLRVRGVMSTLLEPFPIHPTKRYLPTRVRNCARRTTAYDGKLICGPIASVTGRPFSFTMSRLVPLEQFVKALIRQARDANAFPQINDARR
jgi:hypothetical protein